MTATTTTIEQARYAPPPQISLALDTDLDAIAALERTTFSDPWSFDSLREAGSRPYSLFLVGKQAGRLMGYSLSWVVHDELHILKFAIADEHQRQGHGSRLLKETLSEAHRRGVALAWLEVRPSNRAALGLYHSAGFHTAHVRPRYYRDTGEDALVLVRRLGTTENE